MAAVQPSVEKIDLHVPPLEEVASVLEKGLAKVFSEVHVSVVDCPDLKADPFYLASDGLCGQPCVSDIGGIPFLFPLPTMDKVYDLKNIPKWTGLSSGAFIVGAGAGPFRVAGTLSELICNIKVDASGNVTNKSKTSKIVKNGSYLLEELTQSCDAMHLVNLFVSEGKPGKVIEVRAKRRTSKTDFVQSLQTSLKSHYGLKPVGLGGAFLLAKGKANVHVMPCYSKVPLKNSKEIDKWLKYFDMSSPLVSLGYLLSHDPGFNLRMEHFHCFGRHGDGGHFHYDVTPDEAEYVAYFNVPQHMYRVDNYGSATAAH